MSFLVVDKLTLEKSRDSRKSRRPNFKMGLSQRVVEWLTHEDSHGSRKSSSKFSKCVCRKRQLTGWYGPILSLFLESLHYFLEIVWFWEVYVAFGGWQVDFGKFYRLEKIEKAKFQNGCVAKSCWLVDSRGFLRLEKIEMQILKMYMPQMTVDWMTWFFL